MMKWSKRLSALARPGHAGLVLVGLWAGFGDEWLIGRADAHKPCVLPEPRGIFVRRFQQAQAAKAEATDFVIFLDEWCGCTPNLGPYGQRHLTVIIRRWPHVPFPVVIEPSCDVGLDEQRRQLVVEHLLRHGLLDAEERVVIAHPEAEGLYGEEAERIYVEMLTPPRNFSFFGAQFGRGFRGGFGTFGTIGTYRSGAFGPYGY